MPRVPADVLDEDGNYGPNLPGRLDSAEWQKRAVTDSQSRGHAESMVTKS